MRRVTKSKLTDRRFSTHITMHELNRDLSACIRAAIQQPLHVYRYSSPCVCIVGAGLWADINILRSYVPTGHVLLKLRDEIDALLRKSCNQLDTVSDQCVSDVDVAFAIRAWVLQLLHSFGCADLVYTRLGHDMLWRWFVGFESHADSLPDEVPFVQDMQMVSNDPAVIDVVYHCLINNPLLLDDLTELRPNLKHLKTLYTRHFEKKAAAVEGYGVMWGDALTTTDKLDSTAFFDTGNVVYIGTGVDIFRVSSPVSVDSRMKNITAEQSAGNVVDILSRRL